MNVECLHPATYTFELTITHNELMELDRDSDNLLRLHQGQQVPRIDALLTLLLASARLRG